MLIDKPVNLIQKYELNCVGTDYIVGDIHGCFTQLEEKLDKLRFNVSVDRLFAVGDLVDRGAESHRCLEFLDKPWFHSIMGNHEQMIMTDQYHPQNGQYHPQNGQEWVDAETDQDMMNYKDAFSALPVIIEVETKDGLVGIVHADCPLNDWNEFKEEIYKPLGGRYIFNAIWSRQRIQTKNEFGVSGIHRVYVGHTVVNIPSSLGNVYYMDTGAGYHGGMLSIRKL